jgi:hypothetical protein
MIDRPNKVFYISREFNFIDGFFSLAVYQENIIKSMSSGFGPYPVISVKVVNKVATVDIGEQCRLYGGVKINIDGTNVAAIDTWHEIDKVEGNTYSFNVEAPDGEFTAGITMGYPSLGWSLVDRDANNFLFKSGNSASSTHYVLFAFNRGRPANWPEGELWRNTITVEKVECDGTINSIRMAIPKDYTLGMFLPIEMNTPLNFDNMWYFYGDDAYVVMGHKGFWRGGNIHTRRANMMQMQFGELTKSGYKNGIFLINGNTDVQNFWASPNIPPGNYHATISAFAGLLGGNISGFHPTVVGATQVNERNHYMDQMNVTSTAPLWGPDGRSGYNFDKNVTKYVNSNLYGKFTIWNRNWEHMGDVPGVITMVHCPSMVPAFTYKNVNGGVESTVESVLKPVYLMGQYKNRKAYAIYASGYTQTQAGTYDGNNIYWPYQSVCAFDLTGPIR